MDETVPAGWWKAACEWINFPVACVGLDHKFIWVNESFERLVGRSLAELEQLSWTDITHQSDVGGDIASVTAVQNGERSSYTLSKRYQHKFGHYIPVTITVWKFPEGASEALCFVVEASPRTVTHLQLNEVRDEMNASVAGCRKDIQELFQHITKGSHTTVSIGDNAAGDSSGIVKAMMIMIGILTLAVIYVAYYAVAHGTNAPQIPGVSP